MARNIKDMQVDELLAFKEVNDMQIKQGRKLGLRNLVKSCKQLNEKIEDRLAELETN